MNVKHIFQQNWLSLSLCLLALTGITLVSCKANVPTSAFPAINGETSLNPGDIAFTGILYNGDTQFSFVPTTNISAGVSIYFTNYSYDPTSSGSLLVDESTTIYPSSVYPGIGTVNWATVVGGNGVTVTEGTIAYVVGSGGLAAYSQVAIGKTSNAPNVLQGGLPVSISGAASSSSSPYLTLNGNGAGQKILAYAINGGVTVFVAGIIFGPDTWQTSGSVGAGAFWDSYLPSNLTSGVNATDLSGLWASDNLAQYNVNGNNDENQNAALTSCQSTLAGIVSAANWTADGNQAKTKVSLSGIAITPCSNAGYTGSLP